MLMNWKLWFQSESLYVEKVWLPVVENAFVSSGNCCKISMISSSFNYLLRIAPLKLN